MGGARVLELTNILDRLRDDGQMLPRLTKATANKNMATFGRRKKSHFFGSDVFVGVWFLPGRELGEAKKTSSKDTKQCFSTPIWKIENYDYKHSFVGPPWLLALIPRAA